MVSVVYIITKEGVRTIHPNAIKIMTVISNVFIVLGIIFNYDANGVSDFNVRCVISN